MIEILSTISSIIPWLPIKNKRTEVIIRNRFEKIIITIYKSSSNILWTPLRYPFRFWKRDIIKKDMMMRRTNWITSNWFRTSSKEEPLLESSCSRFDSSVLWVSSISSGIWVNRFTNITTRDSKIWRTDRQTTNHPVKERFLENFSLSFMVNLIKRCRIQIF